MMSEKERPAEATVTPEMIEAGCRVWDLFADESLEEESGLGVVETLVKRIYLAMKGVEPAQ